MGSVLDVIRLITQTDPSIQVENLGEKDFIIDYQKPKAPKILWEWLKTGFVCVICFCGAAFAIMTFNNDASVTDVFGEIYRMVLGQEAGEFTVLELSYSIGLALGVILFFNHFCAWKVNTDPTPLEVEMRLYEDNISKTVIQNDGRKESGIDVDYAGFSGRVRALRRGYHCCRRFCVFGHYRRVPQADRKDRDEEAYYAV